MNIEIDKNSGFCFGVVYAIQKAENELQKSEKLYCLGDIVHNNMEIRRLSEKGLITINHQQLKLLKNSIIMIRAHGEPPEAYEIARKNHLTLVDASCPVVLKLQNKIKIALDMAERNHGQVVIYGKKGHAEVNGLFGQTRNTGIVVSEKEDLKKINYTKPVYLFSQTTKSNQGYNNIQKLIKAGFEEYNKPPEKYLNVFHTICKQVSGRGPELKEFVKNKDIVIFVSGKKSSNGRMLYEVCKKENAATFFVSGEAELKKAWFEHTENIGICGATSTPKWLMKKMADQIKLMFR